MSKGVLYLVIFFLLIATWLRFVNSDTLHTLSRDEYSWILAGTSLLETGKPTSWTIKWPFYHWNIYESVRNGVFDGERYSLVTPWMDHPPLFALAIASWVKITDQNIYAPNWIYVRTPMIAVAIATMLLTFLLTKRLFGENPALFTLAAYTFFPAAIISSRFTISENVLSLWLIASLMSIYVVLSNRSNKHRQIALVILLILSFTAPLLKLSGLLVPGSAVLLLLLRKQYRLATYVTVAAALGLGTFTLYGWWYSWEVFTSTQLTHSLRPQSVTNFWSIFHQTIVPRVSLFDPSIIVGFIGLAMLLIDRQNKNRHFLLAPLFMGIVLLLLVAPIEEYSWYKFPLYPLLAIGLGWITHQFWKGVNFSALLLLPLLIFMAEQALTFTQWQQKLFIITLAGVLVLWLLLKKQSLLKQLLSIYLILSLFLLEALWVISVGL